MNYFQAWEWLYGRGYNMTQANEAMREADAVGSHYLDPSLKLVCDEPHINASTGRYHLEEA